MTKETSVQQPKLGDLLAGYLDRQAAAMGAGVVGPSRGDEVMPYDAGPVQPVDAEQAWVQAGAALALFGVEANKLKAPPQWQELVASHEPVLALACAAGNFPQLVRNFHMILHTGDPAELRPGEGRPVGSPELTAWADKILSKSDFPQALLAVGALRLAKQFADATRLWKVHDAGVPPGWRSPWENEKAALLWHQGKAKEALDEWRQQKDSPAVLFNRGMAELFLGETKAAQTSLAAAVKRLPEDSAWQHLAQLYLTLAQARR